MKQILSAAMEKRAEITVLLVSAIALFLVLPIDTSTSVNFFTVFYVNLLKFFAVAVFLLGGYFSLKGIFGKTSIFKEKKNLFINLGIFLITFFFLLVVSELLFPTDPSKITFTEFSEELHHKNKPNFQTVLSQPEWSMEVKTNSLGFRGNEIGEKTATRVLLLGDSFTFGYGVSENETFSSILEKELGTGFEAINAGTISYSPLLEYLQLKKVVEKVKPDIVVLNLDMSDFADDYRYEKEAIVSENGLISFQEPQAQTSFSLISLIKSSKIINFFKVNFLDRLVLSLPLENFIEKDLPAFGKIESDRYGITRDPGNFAPDLQRTFSYIKKINDFSKEKGIKFFLHTYPYGHQVSGTEWGHGRYFWGLKRDTVYSTEVFFDIENFSAKNGIVFFNSLDVVKKNSLEKSLYFSFDGHFNQQGHKLIGEFLAQKIKETEKS